MACQRKRKSSVTKTNSYVKMLASYSALAELPNECGGFFVQNSKYISINTVFILTR